MAIIGESTGDLVRSGHRLGYDTGTVNPLHLEEYGGAVESRMVKASFMKKYITLKPIRGTDTVTNDRIGKTSLQKVSPGVRPTPGTVEFDNISVKVDTIVLARNNVPLLDDFQSHYSVRVEVGNDHGKEIGLFFDESVIIQAIKAAMIVIGTAAGETPAPSGFQSGTQVTLAAAGDELDPDKLQRGIEDAVQGMEEKDVETSEGIILVAPAQYFALHRNDKLISAEYSLGNGDFAHGTVMKTNNMPVIMTNRIPQAAITDHLLSNAGNNNAYNVSVAEAKAVVVIMLPRALLAGETIPLTSKVYYSDIELQWFIDSYLAYAVTPNRAENAAVVFKTV